MQARREAKKDELAQLRAEHARGLAEACLPNEELERLEWAAFYEEVLEGAREITLAGALQKEAAADELERSADELLAQADEIEPTAVVMAELERDLAEAERQAYELKRFYEQGVVSAEPESHLCRIHDLRAERLAEFEELTEQLTLLRNFAADAGNLRGEAAVQLDLASQVRAEVEALRDGIVRLPGVVAQLVTAKRDELNRVRGLPPQSRAVLDSASAVLDGTTIETTRGGLLRGLSGLIKG